MGSFCMHWGDVIGDTMHSAQDPFYIVKEEIQDSIDKLQTSFHQWEQAPSNSREFANLTKELVASSESIEWQFLDRKVDELDKAISVAARDPTRYAIDEVELEKRKRWTSTARNQVSTVRKAVKSGTGLGNHNGMRQEL
ncbi:Syntaxin-61 [Acorus calamus]|uniref:Syntaxin-61 n=1 Tax=Acorus calamus TaxID=4465 RepID=A0AAV9D0G4_ACOCL|nr:Syntaxin-61 [Acorus calamus]